MRHLSLPVFIIGAIAFLITASLAWNYTEAIKQQNKFIEDERAVKASCANTAASFPKGSKDDFYRNCVLQNGIDP